MKVLLVNPYITAYPDSGIESYSEPLGLLYIAAVCRDAGHQVRILDMFGYGIREKLSLDDGRVRVGLGLDMLSELVQSFRPDVAGISSMFSFYQDDCLEISRRIKAIDRSVTVVWGGANASSDPERLLQHECIDFVVAGEGEQAFIQLLEHIRDDQVNIPGVSSRSGDGIHSSPRRARIEDLDGLPFPARAMVKWKDKGFEDIYCTGRIWAKRRKVAAVSTSRGCPFRCVYCGSQHTWSRIWKARSPENILSEIKHLYTDFNIREIHLYDDNASLVRERLLHLCKLIQNEGLDISLAAPNGLYIETLDHELLSQLAAAGFYRITLPIESACDKTIRYINGKAIDLEHVKKVVKSCNELGIWIHANFILGFPDETREDIEETVSYACSLNIDSCCFFLAQPLPNTELCNTFLERGLIRDGILKKDSSVYLTRYDTRHFTSHELNGVRSQALGRFRRTRMRRLLLNSEYRKGVLRKLKRNGAFVGYSLLKKSESMVISFLLKAGS